MSIESIRTNPADPSLTGSTLEVRLDDQAASVQCIPAGLSYRLTQTEYRPFPKGSFMPIDPVISEEVSDRIVITPDNKQFKAHTFYTSLEIAQAVLEGKLRAINPFVLKEGFIPKVYIIRGIPGDKHNGTILADNAAGIIRGDRIQIYKLSIDPIGYAIEPDNFLLSRYEKLSGLERCISGVRQTLAVTFNQTEEGDREMFGLATAVEYPELLPVDARIAIIENSLRTQGLEDPLKESYMERLDRAQIALSSIAGDGKLLSKPIAQLSLAVQIAGLPQETQARLTQVCARLVAITRIKHILDLFVPCSFIRTDRFSGREYKKQIAEGINAYYQEAGRLIDFQQPQVFQRVLSRVFSLVMQAAMIESGEGIEGYEEEAKLFTKNIIDEGNRMLIINDY